MITHKFQFIEANNLASINNYVNHGAMNSAEFNMDNEEDRLAFEKFIKDEDIVIIQSNTITVEIKENDEDRPSLQDVIDQLDPHSKRMREGVKIDISDEVPGLPSHLKGLTHKGIVRSHTYWLHRNGQEYKVLLIANADGKNDSEYPIQIVYQDMNGRIWSKSQKKFLKNRTFIEEFRSW